MLLMEQNIEISKSDVFKSIVLMKKQSDQISLNQPKPSRCFLVLISNAVIFFLMTLQRNSEAY